MKFIILISDVHGDDEVLGKVFVLSYKQIFNLKLFRDFFRYFDKHHDESMTNLRLIIIYERHLMIKNIYAPAFKNYLMKMS